MLFVICDIYIYICTKHAFVKLCTVRRSREGLCMFGAVGNGMRCKLAKKEQWFLSAPSSMAAPEVTCPEDKVDGKQHVFLT